MSVNNNIKISKTVEQAETRTKQYVPKIISGFSSQIQNLNIELTPTQTEQVEEVYNGKVRDRYTMNDKVVLVVSNRLSAFDRHLAEIPFKGAVLNLVSQWWFKQTSHIIKNHIIEQGNNLHTNITVGRKCKPFPIEFVMRGYITGSSGTSLWTHYNKGVREYCGHTFPDGLKKNQKLEKNLLTPTTKADDHDQLISAEEIVKDGWMTQEDWDFCSEKAYAIFEHGQKLANEHGFILVDTKYEFGKDLKTGEILLIDEIHTPDSSRYWLAETYEECMKTTGKPENIDKEFVRLWFRDHCDPYKDETLPDAPKDMLAELSRRYIMLYEMITGEIFDIDALSKRGANINEALEKAMAVKMKQ